MLKGYFSKSFASSFITIFLPLFAIASLILFISMASITSYIEVNLSQMLFIYLYSLPELLFYTLPLAFVVSFATTLNRLSHEYELIVLFSAGITPIYVLKKFFIIALALTLLLLTLAFVIIPQSKQIYESFKNDKLANAKLNVKPSELGQSFGNFFVYIAKEDDEAVFEDVVVFSLSNEEEQLFISNHAIIESFEGDTAFKMIDGKGFRYSPSQIDEIYYDEMTIFQSSIASDKEFIAIDEYWNDLFQNSKKLEKFKQSLYIALMPILTLFAIASFTIIHPRYQKSQLFATLVVTIVSYLTLMNLLSKNATIGVGLGVFIILQLLTFLLFKKRVLRYF